MWENNGHRPYWARMHITLASKSFKLITGFEYQDSIFVIAKNATNSAYLKISEMERATNYFRTWWENKKNVDNYLKFQTKRFKQADKLRKKCLSTNWSKLSEKEIIDIMKESEEYPICFGFVFVTNPQHIIPLEEKLRKLIGDRPDADQIISSVSTPHLELPFDEEQQAVNRLRKKWNKLSKEEQKTALESLSKKYGWFGGVEGEHEYGPEHYEKEIHSEPEKRTIIKPVKVSAEIKKLGKFIGLLSNLRIWGRYHQMSVRYCTKLCIKELSKRKNNPLLEWATSPEIYEYLKSGNLNKTELLKRKSEGYIVTVQNGESILLTGEKAAPYLEKVKEKLEETNMVKGQCANPGKITGKVRIISFVSDSYHDEISKFQNGEILVTGMTRPQIAHLCQKASAIITDEGGITSHAAIVAREFNVPCLIGTHSATKIFKTGDIVEIDAKAGIAKKISK